MPLFPSDEGPLEKEKGREEAGAGDGEGLWGTRMLDKDKVRA